MDIVPIRSIKQYIREFGYEGIVKNHANKSLVKEQILDAFQKEVFGQIIFKYHDPEMLSKPLETIDEKTREGVRHILSNSKWKWKRLCSEFDKYVETRGLLNPDELLLTLKDIVKIQESERKNPEDIPMENEKVEISEIEKAI